MGGEGSGPKTKFSDEYHKGQREYMREYREREENVLIETQISLDKLKEKGQSISAETELSALLKAAVAEFNDAPQPVQDLLVKEVEKAFRRGYMAWLREREGSE